MATENEYSAAVQDFVDDCLNAADYQGMSFSAAVRAMADDFDVELSDSDVFHFTKQASSVYYNMGDREDYAHVARSLLLHIILTKRKQEQSSAATD